MLNNILEEAGLIKESSLKRLLPYLDDAERLGEFTNVFTNSEAGALRSLIEKGGDIARMGAHNAKRFANLQSRFAKDPTLFSQLSPNEQSFLGRLLGKINFDPKTMASISTGSGSSSSSPGSALLKFKDNALSVGSSTLASHPDAIVKRTSPWLKKYKDLVHKRIASTEEKMNTKLHAAKELLKEQREIMNERLRDMQSTMSKQLEIARRTKNPSPWIKKYKELSNKKFKKDLLATGIGAGAGGTALGSLGSMLFGSDEEES